MLLVLECSLYSSVTPLLPHYARALALSKTSAGVLAASYSAGFLAGAPLGGWLAARGVRRALLAGLALLGAAAAAFGVAHEIALLDALRALQGLAGGVVWSGGLVWLIGASPRERLGARLGAAFAAATAGTLLGPVIGTAAASAGGAAVFAALGSLALPLGALVAAAPMPAASPAAAMPWHAALRRDPLPRGAWVMGLAGALVGTAAVLVPLRLASLGTGELAIGATFLAASAVAAGASPVAGRAADAFGPLAPLRASLGLAAAATLLIALARSPLLLCVLAVLLVAAVAGGGIGPCVALVAGASERAGFSLAAATATLNLAFALGEAVGATGGGALAQGAGESVPLVMLAAGAAFTALALGQARRARTAAVGERA